MEDTQFFDQQANWCYQLAWQCLDLKVAYELNVKGNELTAKAREAQSRERRSTKKESGAAPFAPATENPIRSVQMKDQ
jgi:hypothetical protein